MHDVRLKFFCTTQSLSLKALKNCFAFSREKELVKKAAIETLCKDEPCEEDIFRNKRRKVRQLISDSEYEC